jgi:hypothetical protein
VFFTLALLNVLGWVAALYWIGRTIEYFLKPKGSP